MQSAATCVLCGQTGAACYRDLEDHWCGSPGKYSFRRCSACGLLWLDPQPSRAEVATFYPNYYTHGPDPGSLGSRVRDVILRLELGGASHREGLPVETVGRMLHVWPPVRASARVATMHLGNLAPGRLLDVGCGAGRILELARDAGWQAEGLEPDPIAAAATQQRLGITIHVGAAEEADWGEECFDAVTMSHVIEHCTNPALAVQRCHRLLRMGGSLVITTPNPESLAHAKLHGSWCHLDPPRHLFLFSAQALKALVESNGFSIDNAYSSTRNAGATWITGERLATQAEKPSRIANAWRLVSGMVFAGVEAIYNRMRPGCGEELILLARKIGN
jgi:SAM-dependent methyltransferase